MAAELRPNLSDEEAEPDDDDALDGFLDELTGGGDLVLLRLWTSATQAILCPLERSAWDAVTYPTFDGADGLGVVQLLGQGELTRGPEYLN